MGSLKLRTQLIILALFLGLYSLAVGVSYSFVSAAQDELELSFREDLSALTELTRLREEIRSLALLTRQYLFTGDQQWLVERGSALRELGKSEGSLDGLLTHPRERPPWDKLKTQVGGRLAQEEDWIRRRASGRLSVKDAARLSVETGGSEETIRLLTALRDYNVQQLQNKRRDARRAARAGFYMTLAAGLIVGGILVLVLSWQVIGPIGRLESYARGWTLGRDWDLIPASAGPEIQSLYGCLGDMARRLNRDYGREQELARFKTQLVAVVSHEFNNALSVIQGVSVLLEESEGQASPERRQDYYRMIKANVRALGLASDNLLNMGRLESGRFAVNPRRMAIREVAEACLERLEILAQRKGIAVSLDSPEAPIPVRGDPEALSLVVTNLLSNAIKYTPEKGRVSISIGPDAADARRLRFSIKDTGIGIPAEEQKRIFSGYYRTEQGRSAAKGFGVGLSLAKRILEAHDAELELESAPGKGSVFWFSLPVFEGPA